MKRLFGAALLLALAIVLILTKPTPQDIASAASGRMNYIIFNKDKMPSDFATAVAAAAIVQTVQDIFLQGAPQNSRAPLVWHTRDLVFLTYSDLTLAESGALKCIWLLRTGFCAYMEA